MSRRQDRCSLLHLIASTFAVLMLSGSHGVALGQEQIVLKFSHFLGPKSFFQVDVVEPWAKEIEARTNGKVKVEIHNASSPLGKPTEQATQVKAGTVDIALGLRGAEGDKFPGSSLIELPFLAPSAAEGSRVLWRLYRDGPLADEYKDYRLLALFGIEGIVTNWGNPLQGFNDHMKFHTDTQFYTSAFFIAMNRARYDALPADVRAAVDT